MQVWAQAVEAAGSTEFDAVVQALNEGTFDTVLGSLEFTDTGDVTLPGYVFYEWENGEYAMLESSDPSMPGAEAGAADAPAEEGEEEEEPAQ